MTKHSTTRPQHGDAEQCSLARPLHGAACTLGCVVALSALGLMTIWVAGALFEDGLDRTWAPMRVNAALAFVFAGVSLAAIGLQPLGRGAPWGRIVARMAAVATAAVTVATILKYGLGNEFNFDAFLIQYDSGRGPPVGVGPMTPQVAVCFLLISAALLLRIARRTRWHLEAALVAPVAAVALLSLVSALLQVPAYQDFRGYGSLAIAKASGLLLLSVGVLASHGTEGSLGVFVSNTAGGALARRLVPLVVTVPPLLAWLLISGVRVGDYGIEFAAAAFSVATVVILSFVAWHTLASASQADLARRASENALERREHWFRALIEQSADGIAVLSAQGETLYASPAATRLLGIEPADLVGTTYRENVHPEDRARADKVFAEVLGDPGAREALEVRARHGDGSWRWMEVTLTNQLDDQAVHGIVANYRDITARREAEAALRESETRFRQMAEHIREAFFVVDLVSGRKLYVSPTWSEIWGRPILDGYDPGIWFDAIHADDQSAMASAMEQVKQGASTETVFRVQRPDGSTRWVRGRAFAVRNASGTVYRMVGTATDITDLRQAEERFAQAQKMEAIGQLAGGVAHDFNNLLTVIIGEAELVLTSLPADSENATLVREIRSAGESATVLTRQLLAFSRKQLVEATVFPIDETVTRTSKMLRRLIGEDVRLVSKLASDGASVRADQGQIEQVLTNLAVNARDAMPNGGVLTIETSTTTLDDNYSRANPDVQAGEYVVLTVSDSGTGMTLDVQARAFEPFFTTKPRGHGTGLGLATCHGIVKQAGGHINLYSEVNIGTTFRIYLPRVEIADADAVAAPAPVPTGSETMLFVEDDANVRRVGARMLRAQGYNVLEAGDALQALHLLSTAKEPIALLLTDVVMPGMGGRELAEQVRAARPDIKVLFATGYTDDVVLQRQLLERDVALLHKPYTPATLGARVRRVLDGV